MKPGIALRASLMGPALSLLAAAPAAAGVSTGQFRVRLTIQTECKLAVANDVGFGATGDLPPATNDNELIGAQCAASAPYNVGLNAGAGSGATVAVRRMGATTGEAENYTLCRDAAATQIWGDTISSNTLPATSNGAVETFTVYGRAPARTTTPAGNFSDTVQVVITY